MMNLPDEYIPDVHAGVVSLKGRGWREANQDERTYANFGSDYVLSDGNFVLGLSVPRLKQVPDKSYSRITNNWFWLKKLPISHEWLLLSCTYSHGDYIDAVYMVDEYVPDINELADKYFLHYIALKKMANEINEYMKKFPMED